MKELEALKAHIWTIGPASTRFVVKRTTSKTCLVVSRTVTHGNSDKHDLVPTNCVQCRSDGVVDVDSTLIAALRLAASRLDTWVARSNACRQHRRKRAYRSLVRDLAKIYNHIDIIRNDDLSIEILLRTYRAMKDDALSWDGVLKSVSLIKERLATKSAEFAQEQT